VKFITTTAIVIIIFSSSIVMIVIIVIIVIIIIVSIVIIVIIITIFMQVMLGMELCECSLHELVSVRHLSPTRAQQRRIVTELCKGVSGSTPFHSTHQCLFRSVL
jgi:hypothetical protein